MGRFERRLRRGARREWVPGVPNYQIATLKHLETCPVPRGEHHHLEIRHGADCAFYDGLPCNCNPDILTGPMIDEKYRRIYGF
jgi:hypothetical protein